MKVALIIELDDDTTNVTTALTRLRQTVAMGEFDEALEETYSEAYRGKETLEVRRIE